MNIQPSPAQQFISPHDVARYQPVRRRKWLEILLIIVSGLLLMLPGNWLTCLPLNIGLVEGTLATTEHFNARSLVLAIPQQQVTLRSGTDSGVVVEVTRYGFGTSALAGRVAAERLALPEMYVDGETLHISASNDPGVNLSLFGRPAYAHYTITAPSDVLVDWADPNGQVQHAVAAQADDE